jgi:Uma2 family endonuclease
MSRITRKEPAIVLGPDWNGALMTPEEFDAVQDYDECYVYELINGVVVVSPIPAEAEVDPNEDLGYLLRLYKETHPKGRRLDATLPERYGRTANSRRRADRVIWAGLGRLPDSNVDVPTIAVEFVSKGTRNRRRDYITKRDEYLEIGVAEYWIIDRFSRTLTVYRAGAAETVIAENKTYRSRLLPGFVLPLARLLAVADRWSPTHERPGD